MRKVNELISSEINLLYSIRKRIDLNSNDFAALLILSDALNTIENNKQDINLKNTVSIINNIIKLSKFITSTSQYAGLDYEYSDNNEYVMANENTFIKFTSNGESFLFVSKYN